MMLILSKIHAFISFSFYDKWKRGDSRYVVEPKDSDMTPFFFFSFSPSTVKTKWVFDKAVKLKTAVKI